MAHLSHKFVWFPNSILCLHMYGFIPFIHLYINGITYLNCSNTFYIFCFIFAHVFNYFECIWYSFILNMYKCHGIFFIKCFCHYLICVPSKFILVSMTNHYPLLAIRVTSRNRPIKMFAFMWFVIFSQKHLPLHRCLLECPLYWGSGL
jgi:hypothetical protein